MNRSLLGWIMTALVGAGPAHAGPRWTESLVSEALTKGFEATLPPHASMVLGLAQEGERVAVRQLVERSEKKVRTFNVCVAHHRDIVLFLVDEGTQSATAYLVTPGGALRMAVSYQSGGQPHLLTRAEARSAFLREVRYWSQRAPPLAPEPTPH